VIAVDTNLLVYAHRGDSPFHESAAKHVKRLAEGRAAWAIPWPCIHEFLAIVTHRKIYQPPTPMEQAVDQVEAWRESPNLQFIGELGGYWDKLKTALLKGNVSGTMTHDARIATICRQHEVAVLWSADRDFSRFSGIKIVNPLVDSDSVRK
jgi:toxin-antitoxin system PIN domain toxin